MPLQAMCAARLLRHVNPREALEGGPLHRKVHAPSSQVGVLTGLQLTGPQPYKPAAVCSSRPNVVWCRHAQLGRLRLQGPDRCSSTDSSSYSRIRLGCSPSCAAFATRQGLQEFKQPIDSKSCSFGGLPCCQHCLPGADSPPSLLDLCTSDPCLHQLLVTGAHHVFCSLEQPC